MRLDFPRNYFLSIDLAESSDTLGTIVNDVLREQYGITFTNAMKSLINDPCDTVLRIFATLFETIATYVPPIVQHLV